MNRVASHEPKPKILCTIGPSSRHPDVLRAFQRLGVDILRLNLSHTLIDEIEPAIIAIQQASSIPLCIDSEGAQIRTGAMAKSIARLEAGSTIQLGPDERAGDADYIPLTPLSCFAEFRAGDLIALDFNTAVVRVIEPRADGAVVLVVSSGLVGTRKAVSLNREIPLPDISEKDLAAIEIGRARGVTHFALSFAQSAEAVQRMRSLCGPKAFIIAKIESLSGLRHLDEIAGVSDALLIDRGDLSRQVPITDIPRCQRWILSRAADHRREVYVATNLMESMIAAPYPTRAEVSDIFHALEEGAAGLVLAAETAVGRYPVECVSLARSMITKATSAVSPDDEPIWQTASWRDTAGALSPPWIVPAPVE